MSMKPGATTWPAASITAVASPARRGTDGGDPVAVERDVGGARGRAAPVDDRGRYE